MNNKIVLIRKYNSSNFFWKNLFKNKKINELTVEQLINKYKGFEGNLIEFYSIDENKIEFDSIINAYLKLNSNEYLLLFIATDDSNMSVNFKKYFLQVGYDVGVCEHEKTIFSSIFNEILFGFFDELILYKNFLNDNLLFPNKILANKYIDSHNKLSLEGKEVEDYEKLNIYNIWKYTD